MFYSKNAKYNNIKREREPKKKKKIFSFVQGKKNLKHMFLNYLILIAKIFHKKKKIIYFKYIRIHIILFQFMIFFSTATKFT